MAKPATMRAATISSPGRVEMHDVQMPDPAAKQVRVRVEGCGVCASNLAVWQGRSWFNYPQEAGAPGHEAWGIIESTGDNVRAVTTGQRVAMLSYKAYAEYDIAEESEVVVLPHELASHPFPAEPLACALNIFRRSGIEAGQTVAIIGIGFLGALLTRLCANAGARVLALSRREFALEIARAFGAEETIRLDDHHRIIEHVRRVTNGRMCDCTIEAVGEQWPLDLAGELTAERGRLVIAGFHQDGPRRINMQLWNWRGLDVINAHERDPRVYMEGMRAAVDAVASGRLDPLPLLTHTVALQELGSALEAARTRPDGFMKALVLA